MVARQALRFRKRVTRRTTKQRLIDSRKLLRTLRLLAKEVRGHKLVILRCWLHMLQDSLWHRFLLFIAPDHHPRCVSVASEWQKKIGLCPDSRLLHPLLIGGGAEGAGQWPGHHPLHEGNCSKAKINSFWTLPGHWCSLSDLHRSSTRMSGWCWLLLHYTTTLILHHKGIGLDGLSQLASSLSSRIS